MGNIISTTASGKTTLADHLIKHKYFKDKVTHFEIDNFYTEYFKKCPKWNKRKGLRLWSSKIIWFQRYEKMFKKFIFSGKTETPIFFNK